MDNDELLLKGVEIIGNSTIETSNLLGNEEVDISNYSEKEIKNMVNNCKRKLLYAPAQMWFDYQALFDKARNKILCTKDNILVRHVDFDKNFHARNAIFSKDKIDKDVLKKILEGDLDCIFSISYNIWKYEENNRGDINFQESENIYKNHLFFLAISVSLGEADEGEFNHYWVHVNPDFVPDYLNFNSLQKKDKKMIENMNFYAIIRPIMGNGFFDKSLY